MVVNENWGDGTAPRSALSHYDNYAPTENDEPPPETSGFGDVHYRQGFCSATRYALGKRGRKALLIIPTLVFFYFVASFLGDYMPAGQAVMSGLIVAVAVWPLTYIALVVGEQQHHTRKRRAINRAAGVRHAKYEVAMHSWHATRPLTVIASATEPFRALHNRSRPTDIYIGGNQSTHNIVTVARNHSVMVLGLTQRGKTTGISQPMHLAHTGPLVSVSTKPDTFDATYRGRQAIGTVWYFDPAAETDPALLPPGVVSAMHTPLAGCTSWDDSMITAAQMVGATPAGAESSDVNASHWKETSELLLAPLLFAAYLHQDLNILTVRDWVFLRTFSEPLAILRAVQRDTQNPKRSEAKLALLSLTSMMALDPKHISSVVSVAVTVMKVYLHTNVDKTAGETNFDADAFVRSSDTVYISTSADQQEQVSPLISAFIVSIQQAAYRYNKADAFMDSTRPSVLVILDEAANAARMKDLPRYVSEGASQGFQVVVLLQNPKQAEVAWPIQGTGFFDYFSVKIVLSGTSDDRTLEALSVLTGDVVRTYRGTNSSHTVSHGESESTSSGWAGGLLTGQASGSRSVSSNEGYSYSSGTSTSQVKERMLSKGDVASIGIGEAIIQGPGHWEIIDLVGVRDWRWQQVLASLPPALPSSMTPAVLPSHGDTRLLPVQQLLDAERARLATPVGAGVDSVQPRRDP